jgi:hypothetical protein
VLLLLLTTVVVLVNYTPFQNFIVDKVANTLSKNLKTKVAIKHVRIDFLNHVSLQGVLIQDQAHDTLLYAGEASVRITDWFIFKDKPVLHYLGLKDTYARLYRGPASKAWNYDFIADAFSTGKKSPNKQSKPFEFDLEKVEFENVRFHMDDKWIGEDIDFDFGELTVDAEGLDFDKKVLDVAEIASRNTLINVREYKGGRPKWMKPKKPDTPDTTPFNPDGWAVNIKKLALDDFIFRLKGNDREPVPGLFDENHLDITQIKIYADGIKVVGDTITGNVSHMSANERCGLQVKKMHAKVSVSPIASVCKELYLETNHSVLKDYYAMHYKRFPDFLEYIDSVTMVGHLKNSTVDKRDLAFFAPQLHELPPTVFTISGDGKGTVANISARNLRVSEGNVSLKGNLTMRGLPDIYETYITFTDGEILTTGSGILHYVPELRNSPDVSIESITYAFFKGRYEGFIENFSVNGVFQTNLGSIATNMSMAIPGFSARGAVYSGTVAADRLQLGTFFRQPLLGAISFKEKITGRSFHSDIAQMDIDGVISEFTVKGYPYHNIINKGTLAKKQFIGSLLIDDPHLGMTFNGGINYSGKEVNINATAHLLGSNFKALNLTSDLITASADFDLNCTGSNIDNFYGYAKLFNIDLHRNNHKLDVDSIYVNSTGEGAHKSLTVQSNDIVARIKGDYQLSMLPASFQYYLSRYIPNYIKAPEKFAPNQNFEFSVRTVSIDSILAVTVPLLRGFDSSTITGSLNTQAQKLTFKADVPHATIGRFHLNSIDITGTGNFNNLGLNTEIENISIGDSMLNGSLSLTTTIGNDSVTFNLATTSPDISSSITLNGLIIAHNDTLSLSLKPSQIYLNRSAWDVAGGSSVVYSDKYLLIKGLSLTSGLQRISAATEQRNNENTILINTENIDVAQLGAWAGMASYQPDGRLNGTVRIERIFSNPLVSANIKATGVMLGADTVGTVNVIGTYDAGKSMVNLDPQTGIYRGNASIVASGNIAFDTTKHQKLDGAIQFNAAPIAWASPFLTGLMSGLKGTVSGSVALKGSTDEPVIKGTVAVRNGAFRMDYLGCNYTVPYGEVDLDDHFINMNKIQIFDRFNNYATLTGYFSHNLFQDMRMRLKLRTEKMEVMNLASTENDIIYGNLIARMDSFRITGPFNNIRLRAYNASPAAKSHIYMPVPSTGSVGTYNYVTFKTYGKSQEPTKRRSQDKLQIDIDANLNELAEMTIVMDPTNGDAITAKGVGRIQLLIPPTNDMSITGIYTIREGNYVYTFPQLSFLRRQFALNEGSVIRFNGPFMETSFDVDAKYSVFTRLSDLLTSADRQILSANELNEAKIKQTVNVLLHMGGTLGKMKLTFDLDLPEKRSVGTYAYTKLMRINQDERQKLEQVGALLLLGNFLPPDGGNTSGVARSGAFTNASPIFTTLFSDRLTNLANKMIGDNRTIIDVNYRQYDDQGTALTRNTFSGTISRKFNDRISVEGGLTSDIGRTTTGTRDNYLTGNFRTQLVISKSGNLRLNVFANSNYDPYLARSVPRTGVGISWRRSFDNLNELIRPRRALRMPAEEQEPDQKTPANPVKDTTVQKPSTSSEVE